VTAGSRSDWRPVDVVAIIANTTAVSRQNLVVGFCDVARSKFLIVLPCLRR
jgi:hypothetical protein